MLGKSILPALLALALAPATTAVMADAYVDIERRLTPEQMRETGLDTLTPQQLQRLNLLLRDANPAEAGENPAAALVPDASAESERRERQAAASPAARLQEIPIRARVQGMVAGWQPGTVFVLDNGQRWQVLKGRAELREPLQSPEVIVVPGLAGRYFLQVHEDLPKARVYRID